MNICRKIDLGVISRMDLRAVRLEAEGPSQETTFIFRQSIRRASTKVVTTEMMEKA